MPRLLLPAASATCHLSLYHFHCYCYSCPCLCHITAPHSTLVYVGRYVRLGCLERVIRTAARLIGGHLSAYMLDVLHWLPLQKRIPYWCHGLDVYLARPTSEIFTVPPRAPEVAVHSAH